jgi:hypothetical protein
VLSIDLLYTMHSSLAPKTEIPQKQELCNLQGKEHVIEVTYRYISTVAIR